MWTHNDDTQGREETLIVTLRSQGINVTHGFTVPGPQHVYQVQLLTINYFWHSSGLPAGAAKQILIQFQQVIHRARQRGKKNEFKHRRTCTHITNCLRTQAAALKTNRFWEGDGCEQTGPSLRAFQFEDIFFDKTHNECNGIKSTKVLHQNSIKLYKIFLSKD